MLKQRITRPLEKPGNKEYFKRDTWIALEGEIDLLGTPGMKV